MRFRTAVGHVRSVVDALEDEARFARGRGASPTIVAAYVFGPLLDAPDELEGSDLALEVDRTPAELPWGVEPAEVLAFFERHGLHRFPLRWWCRPAGGPVTNHRIDRPLRVWSTEGVEAAALQALAEGQAGPLRPPAPDVAEQVGQLEDEAEVCLAQLDDLVHGHRGAPRSIADDLFDLAWGYTDLRRALARLRGEPPPAVEPPRSGLIWTDDRYTRLRAAVRQGAGGEVVDLLADQPLAEVAQLAGEALLTTLEQRVEGAGPLARRCVTALRERDWEGDEELAADLDAALGEGPAPLRRAVPVDLEEIASHLDGGGMLEEGIRVDVVTGSVWPDFEDLETMTGEPAPDDWEDPDRWLVVTPRGSRDAYGDMVAFTATVADRRLADRLDRALEGRGAFRRFRDVLTEREEEAVRWRVFSEERARGRARAWLALEGFRPA